MKAESFVRYQFGDTNLFNFATLQDKTLLRTLPIYEANKGAIDAYIVLDQSIDESFSSFGRVAYYGSSDGVSAISHVTFDDIDQFNAWKQAHSVDLHTLGMLRQDLMLTILKVNVGYVDSQVVDFTVVGSYDDALAAINK